MELLLNGIALFCAVYISFNAWKFFNWVWVKPRKLEKWLREQGFNGNSYKFLVGDYKKMALMAKETQSKHILFSDDIVPRVMPFVSQSVKSRGENCFLWFGPKPAVFISEPDLIKEILSKNYIFQKTSTPLDKLLAQGVAAYETDKWAKHRRLINPAFHLENLKNMVPSFYLSCADMLKKWGDIVREKGGSHEVDVWPYLQTMSSDAISRTAFGSNYEDGKKIFQLLKEQSALVMQALLNLYVPGWRFLPTKTNRRMKKISKEVESLILGIINRRMREVEAGEGSSNDLLGILLESNLKEIQHNGDGYGMSMKDVIEECKLFYIAGQETTSSLLVWAMILLSKHPDWQVLARNEVLQNLRDDRPSFQGLNHLKIVNMILSEVLRLYPPIVMMSRRIDKETKVGKVTLPSGIEIFLPTLLVHHDTRIWGESAKEFDPQRFHQGVAKATKGKLSYFPFGGGPRICIGQNFAMLEAKMALAMILKSFSFELSSSYTHAPDMVVTLQPQFGAHLILHKLN
ncbi:cytochrome P450 monooxygenase [Striga asiatica]|uniref:Cytochrome P450 monooxygenase n=1 Tax=Striga asiatica TaxID=4170 RepID=A0A5A7QG60_STRAF|nr:cytochrome P450 monooxygenase [Striga asiatica]